ncbi:DUF3499 domain-containing protein [Corynebacterium sp. sy039]|nr:DUF3499 domain-containing protein [Corynebacterium sp. sy039]
MFVNQFRRCSRPGCGKPAVATLTYAYAQSTAVVGPLMHTSDPHSWDLCEYHASRITAPMGWELVRVDDIDDDEDLTALAQAVREAGQTTSGLVDPVESDHKDDKDNAQPSAQHPVHRAQEHQKRRAHLRVISSQSDVTQRSDSSSSRHD